MLLNKTLTESREMTGNDEISRDVTYAGNSSTDIPPLVSGNLIDQIGGDSRSRSNIALDKSSCTEKSPDTTLKSDKEEFSTLPKGIENDTILGIPPKTRTGLCLSWLANNKDCSSWEVIFVTSMLGRDFETSLRLFCKPGRDIQRPILDLTLAAKQLSNTPNVVCQTSFHCGSNS